MYIVLDSIGDCKQYHARYGIAVAKAQRTHTQYYDSHKLQRIAELTRGGHKGSIRYVVAVIGILGTLGVSWGWLLKTIL
jgi:hypothetical protein